MHFNIGFHKLWKYCILKLLQVILLLSIGISNKNGVTVEGRAWPRSYNGTVYQPSLTTAVSRRNLEDSDSFTMGYATTTIATTAAERSIQSSNENIEDICKNALIPSGSMHAHPSICSKYIECGPGGTVFLKTCGPGTVFNPVLSICDWPNNVDRCKTVENSTENELVEELHPRGKRSLAAYTLSPESIEQLRRFRRKEERITPDKIHCNRYHLVSEAGGIMSTHTCGKGTLFNPISLVCDFADNVDCSGRRADFATYGCEDGDVYRAPHPDNCDKFVECENGVLAIKSCARGTLYWREGGFCEHSYKVKCRTKISLKYDIRKKRQTSNIENGLNLACDYNYIAPHPENCFQFVECEDKRIFVKNCGPGTAFNSRLGQCDWPYNVREAEPSDCTTYRQCVRTHFERRQCRQGQLFDDRLGTCVNAPEHRIRQCRRTRFPTTTTKDYDYDRRPLPTPPPSRK